MSHSFVPRPDQDVTPAAADRLEQIVDALQTGGRPTALPVSPVERAAVKLQALSDHRLDPAVDAAVMQQIMQRTQVAHVAPIADRAGTVVQSARRWWLLATGGLVGAATLAVVVFVITTTTPVPTKTIAEAQGTPSLTEAETLLAALPADATVNGIPLARVRSQIHEIAQQRAETDTRLDPTATSFPHVELRDSALELIDRERETLALVQTDIPDPVLDQSITQFSQAVSTWPTSNIGVSFSVHQKAVSTFQKHATTWDAAMTALAEQLVKQYRHE